MPRPILLPLARTLSCVALAALARPAAAQSGGDGYLFGRPHGSFTVRGGYDRPNAQGQLFDDVVDQLTLGRSAFAAPAVNAELAFALGSRVDLAFSAGFAGTSRSSEFRRFVDQSDQPITQTTSLRRVPLGASLKLYLAPRGREIGRFAWIPTRVAPFVGAGGGATYYRFRQQGSFVDFQTLDVFDAESLTSGWVPTGHAFAGADYSLSPRFVLSGELRYTVARGTPSGDFRDYSRIDLSGASANVGLGVRF